MIFSRKFVGGLVIYAVIFLILAGIGLGVFWKFIDAYEQSRPKNTLKAYMDQLTIEQMCDDSDELYNSVDQNLQSREQFNQVIRDAVTEKLGYAKKSSESTEQRQVYVVRCGKNPIGKFTIEAGEEDAFGFRIWEVTEHSFDFSHLMGQSVSITVPSDFQVSVNGNVLDENYITKSGIHYSALEEFYDSYDLPAMVTYSAENFLGEAAVAVTDTKGNPVEITSETDMNSFLPQCSQEELTNIETFADEFVRLWMNFSGSRKATAAGNYYQLKKILSSDGALAERLKTAVEGLAFGQTNGIKVQEVNINRCVPLGDGVFMCDMTYMVRTTGKKGPVDTTSNMKLILVTEDGAYKVKSMERY